LRFSEHKRTVMRYGEHMIDIQPIVEQPLFTVKEAMVLLRASRSTVWRMIWAGKLDTTRVGKRGVRIYRASLEKYTKQ